MKMNRSLYLLALALLAGCSGKGGGPEPTPSSATTPPLVEKAGLGIPEELVTDGLKAMGYPFDKTIEYEVTGFPVDSKSTQSMTVTYETKSDGQHVDAFNKAVEPSNLPSESYAIEKDAVYGVAAGGDEISPRVKAMSATPAIGEKWESRGTLKTGDIVMDTIIKIVGRQQVSVRAGEYDALVMIETGTIKIGANPPTKVEGKSWYVDGIGAVKRTISQTDSSGKTSNLTMGAVSIK
jgi:hypothetical protein